MKVMRGIKKAKIQGPAAVTVGIFDGVHRGHMKILRELKKRARDMGGKSCVVTFEPHPARVLYPRRRPPMLVSARHKLELLAAAGIDFAVVVKFTKRLAAVSPRRFVEEALVKRLHTKELVIGEGFSFGKEKAGTITELRELGRKLRFRVRVVPLLTSGKRVVSSSLIRKLILAGQLVQAKKLMGREIAILGTVTQGARRGKGLGFPTANLDLHHEAIPPSGVYIVKVKLEGRRYRGVLNIGFRPTFDRAEEEKEPTAEVHIFGMIGSLYGKDIEVILLKRIRRERKFRNKERLRLRIKKDMEITKSYFKKEKREKSEKGGQIYFSRKKRSKK